MTQNAICCTSWFASTLPCKHVHKLHCFETHQHRHSARCPQQHARGTRSRRPWCMLWHREVSLLTRRRSLSATATLHTPGKAALDLERVRAEIGIGALLLDDPGGASAGGGSAGGGSLRPMGTQAAPPKAASCVGNASSFAGSSGRRPPMTSKTSACVGARNGAKQSPSGHP